MDTKAKFLKVYANLPFSARQEIIALIENEPFTWNSSKIEIENDSIKGKQILEQLIKLSILKTNES